MRTVNLHLKLRILAMRPGPLLSAYRMTGRLKLSHVYISRKESGASALDELNLSIKMNDLITVEPR